MQTHPISFQSLGLIPSLCQQLDTLGFNQPTAVQQHSIAPMLAGADIRVRANTGSGKTAAFGLPLLQLLSGRTANARGNQVRALVLLPSRELAQQVGADLRRYGAQLNRPLKIVTLFGGVSLNPQMLALRGGADIVVATPGRLLDLLGKNALKLAQLEHLVLDEADKLLGLGFSDELNALFAQLPTRRQTAFFSATFGDTVAALADSLLNQPVVIDLCQQTEPADIHQQVYEVEQPRKTQLLIKLLAQHQWPQVLVFANAKQTCNRLQQKLQRAGIRAEVFHGDKSQGNRSSVLDSFKQGRIKLLIATDIAARGLDITGLPAVVNYELPRSPADYIHRIGRTGRAGASGEALSLICSDEFHHFRVIEKKHKLRLPRQQFPGFEFTPEQSSVTASAKPVSQSKKVSKGCKLDNKTVPSVKNQ